MSTGADTFIVHDTKLYCPNVKQTGRDWWSLTYFLLFLFSNHKALCEMFLKAVGEHYFPFILKNIFALYSLLSIIVLRHIPCCPLKNLNGVAVYS